MSLRARLIATLLALAAAGMLVLAAVTYATQRSFLLQRVDDQTRSAVPALERQFGAHRGPPHGGPRQGPGGPRGLANLPSGTFGELRAPDGRALAAATISYGEAPLPRPDVPTDLRPGEVRTVDAVAGDLRYRLRALPLPGGGVLVVAIPLAGVEETLENLVLVEALVILAVLVLLGLLAGRLVRLGLRPLDRIAAVAGDIAGGDMAHRVEITQPQTEVGRLGQAINAMLGRLEAAFAEREASERRLRQFLADASHELRTPLASIRGYAELFRLGAADDPARAVGRIEEEAARMGVLVEEMLALARLDETREPVREPVALGDLAADAAQDARATAPDRRITARCDGEPVVAGDPDQLRQVAANLVRNALVHTPPGTPVEVVARAQDGRAILEVRDHGPGLPPGDRRRLFERFWRGEGPGRGRGRAGAGLGLAIVAAIVAAHGGEVDAADAPGGGALFTVHLPRLE